MAVHCCHVSPLQLAIGLRFFNGDFKCGNELRKRMFELQMDVAYFIFTSNFT